MVAFPKTGTERREGHHAEQNPRADPRAVPGADQGANQEPLGEAHAGGTEALPGGAPHQRERLLHPGPPHPVRPLGRPQGAPGEGRGLPPQAPPLPQTYLHRAFRGHSGPLRQWGKHQGHFPVPGDSVRGVLLSSEHLPPHPSGGGGGQTVEESPTCAGVLRHLPGRDLPFGEAGGRRPRNRCTWHWGSGRTAAGRS